MQAAGPSTLSLAGTPLSFERIGLWVRGGTMTGRRISLASQFGSINLYEK
jgi:hypothetical protein